MTVRRRHAMQAAAAAAVTAAVGPARAATPFFKLYVMIPNNQPARVVWGTLAAEQMKRIGIDVVGCREDASNSSGQAGSARSRQVDAPFSC